MVTKNSFAIFTGLVYNNSNQWEWRFDMDIRNIRQLKDTAGQRLETARDEKKIILLYSGITLAASLLVTLICYCLDLQIAQSGGLSRMGTKAVLSTLDQLLPMLLNIALLCVELGFLACMIRISRGLYTSVQTLRAGLPRFWAMIRANLLLLLRYFVVAVGCFYLADLIFALTPLSNTAMELLAAISASADPSALILDETVALQLLESMIPMLVIFCILFAAVIIPMTYRYRMVNYILLDKPQIGAASALRESKQMMYHNRSALFKLDLSFWWYYLLMGVANLICYGDVLLPLVGITLPVSEDLNYFLWYGLYLAALFGIYYGFRNKVGVTYALAYDAVKPKEKDSGGVVLGNIFQM